MLCFCFVGFFLCVSMYCVVFGDLGFSPAFMNSLVVILAGVLDKFDKSPVFPNFCWMTLYILVIRYFSTNWLWRDFNGPDHCLQLFPRKEVPVDRASCKLAGLRGFQLQQNYHITKTEKFRKKKKKRINKSRGLLVQKQYLLKKRKN